MNPTMDAALQSENQKHHVLMRAVAPKAQVFALWKSRATAAAAEELAGKQTVR